MPAKMSKAAKKALKAAQKAEKLLQSQKDNLTRQMALSQVNRITIEKKYKEMIRQMRVPIMREQLSEMWSRFDFATELKNYNISCLVDDLDKEEEQQLSNFECHMDIIDRMFVVFMERWDDIHEWFTTELAEMQTRAKNFSSANASAQQSNEEDLRAMLFQMNQFSTSYDEAYKTETDVKKDELLNLNGDTMNLMRTRCERKMDVLWFSCKESITNFLQNTKEKRIAYNKLKVRDTKMASLLKRQSVVLANLYVEIKSLQERLAESRKIQMHKRTVLAKEREYYVELYLTNEKQLEHDTSLDKSQLKEFVLKSNDTIQSLQETLRKSEKILELASICRKFETEDEVIRWYDNYIDAANKKDSFLKVDEEEDDIETKLGKEVPPQLQKAEDNLDLMEKFWQRVGEAHQKSIVMKSKLENLKKENKYLKEALRQYLGEYAIENGLVHAQAGGVRHDLRESEREVVPISCICEICGK